MNFHSSCPSVSKVIPTFSLIFIFPLTGFERYHLFTLSYTWTPGNVFCSWCFISIFISHVLYVQWGEAFKVLWISDNRVSFILCPVPLGKSFRRKDMLHHFISLYLCVWLLRVWLQIQFLGNWLLVILKSNAEISLRIQRWARSTAELCSQIPGYSFLPKLRHGPATCNFCKQLPEQ